MADTVRGIFTILFKFMIFLLCLHVFMFTVLYVWIFIQANSLANDIAQELTESNYLDEKAIESIGTRMEEIYGIHRDDHGVKISSCSGWNKGSQIDRPNMGIENISISFTNKKDGRNYRVTAPYRSLKNLGKYRCQSGTYFEVKVLFNYLPMGLMMFQELNGVGADDYYNVGENANWDLTEARVESTSLLTESDGADLFDMAAINGGSEWNNPEESALLAASLDVGKQKTTITKHTIGMKYYPDIEQDAFVTN